MSDYVIPAERVTPAPSGRFGFVLVDTQRARVGPKLPLSSPTLRASGSVLAWPGRQTRSLDGRPTSGFMSSLAKGYR